MSNEETPKEGSAPKKEKVLHARVPESLDRELKERARSLGISVSNLVRNVLTNTFDLVEDIVVDGSNIARSARGEAPLGAVEPATAADRPRRNRVVGWHVVVLNLNAVCHECNEILAKGTKAGVGVMEHGGTPPAICPQCMESLSDGSSLD